MSDDTTTDATEVEEIENSTETETDFGDDLEKWKAHSKKNEALWKAAQKQFPENSRKAAEWRALREKATEYDKYVESQKTELQKALDRAEAAERRVSETELSAMRTQVALEHGLTPTQAKRLVGSTLDEIQADALELLADLKASKPNPAPSADGQGKQGEPVGQTQQITSRDQLASMSREEKLAAYRDGRLKSLTG